MPLPEFAIRLSAALLMGMLLDAGARLDIRGGLVPGTPLDWACRWGRSELPRLFLERGEGPEERSAPPWATPAAWAKRAGIRLQ
jgi:hypothetical protein